MHNDDPVRLVLGVYRRDLHVREGPIAERAQADRCRALDQTLNDSELRVTHWGDTKDKQPHEWVQVVVELVTTIDPRGFLDSIVEPGVKQFAEEYAKGFAGAAAASTVAAVVRLTRKLTRRAENREIHDFDIRVTGGGFDLKVKGDAVVTTYPSQHPFGPKVEIRSRGRKPVTIAYGDDFPGPDESEAGAGAPPAAAG